MGGSGSDVPTLHMLDCNYELNVAGLQPGCSRVSSVEFQRLMAIGGDRGSRSHPGVSFLVVIGYAVDHGLAQSPEIRVQSCP